MNRILGQVEELRTALDMHDETARIYADITSAARI